VASPEAIVGTDCGQRRTLYEMESVQSCISWRGTERRGTCRLVRYPPPSELNRGSPGRPPPAYASRAQHNCREHDTAPVPDL